MSELGERFWSKVDSSGECWLWTAVLNSAGYGRYWRDGKMRARAKQAEAERDAAREAARQLGRAALARAKERDALRERLDALRADVERKCEQTSVEDRGHTPPLASRVLAGILDRDTERAEDQS